MNEGENAKSADRSALPEEPARYRELTPFEADLLVALARTIQRRFPEGLPAWATDRVEEVTDRMVDSYPDAGVVDDIIGPAYTTRGLARYWQCSPATIRRQSRKGQLLALKTTKGSFVYPNFQFDSDGNVIAGLLGLINSLTPMYPDPWECARWLATEPTEPSPIELLRAGDIAAALARAQRFTASKQSAQPPSVSR
jgi:hypothetical protein